MIGATVGAGVRAAVGSTIAQVGRLGKEVEAAEKRKAEALKETARLDTSAQQIVNYRALGRAVLEAGRAHREAQERVRGLAREIAAGEAPTRAQERALEAARRAVVAAAAAEAEQKRRLAGLRTELNGAGIDTRRLGDAERKLAADTAAAQARLDQAARSANRLGEAMARAEQRREIGGQLKGEALKIGAAYMALRQPLRVAGDFEHQLVRFGNTAGMNAGELEELRQQLRGMSTEVGQSAGDLLSGMDVLVGKGMDAKTAAAAIKDIGRAATATGADMADMSDLSFNVISNLHVPVDKLGLALDMMAQAGKEGGFELKNMAQQFPQLTNAAASLGLTGTEAVTSLSAMLQVAMKGASDPSTAANNLANFLQKITASDAKKNFEKFGIDIAQELADGVAAGQNPVEVAMQQIAKASGADLNQAMADAFDTNGKMVEGAAEKISARFKLGELFGDKQVQDFVIPMLANYQDYLRIKQKAAAADGTIGKDFAAISKTYNESTKRLGLAWDNLMGSIGKALIPHLVPVVDAVAHGVDAVANLADAAPIATAGLTLVVGGFVTLKAAILTARLASLAFRGGLGGLTRDLLRVGQAGAAAGAGLGDLGGGGDGRPRPGGRGGRLGRMGGLLRTGGKALGGAGLVVGGVMAADTLLDDKATREEKGGAVGSFAGGAAGALAGAAIGSVVPVVGTALGAIVGGLLGGLGGEKLGEYLARDKDKPPDKPAGAPAPDPTLAAATPAPAGPVTIGPTTITINPPAGMDARALAEQVFKLIEDKRRAALHD
ncbi:MAG: hypothetical protein RLZZ501_769 [Pseudomonadota bacterium]